MQRKKTKMTLNIQKLISFSLAVIKAHLNKFKCLYEHTAFLSFVLMKSHTLMDKSVIYWIFFTWINESFVMEKVNDKVICPIPVTGTMTEKAKIALVRWSFYS